MVKSGWGARHGWLVPGGRDAVRSLLSFFGMFVAVVVFF